MIFGVKRPDGLGNPGEEMTNNEYFDKIFEMLNERQSNHSRQMQDGFEKVHDENKEIRADIKEVKEFMTQLDKRVSKAENEKHVWNRILTPVFSIFGGSVAGWISKHF